MQNLTYITHTQKTFSTIPLSLSVKTIQEYQKKQEMAASSLYSEGLILHCLILAFCIAFPSLHASEPPLTLDYYKSTCPTVLDIVRKEMECAVLSDPRNAALILRLHFHDCFVQVTFFITLFHCIAFFVMRNPIQTGSNDSTLCNIFDL